jgi:hypothetical protein
MFRFSAGPVSTGNNSAIQVVAVSCLVFLCMISAGCGGSASPFVKGLVSQQKNKFEQTLRSTISLPDSLPDAIVGRLYSAVLEPQGSHAPYHFLLLAGELPDGLSMDSSNGRISGRPLVPGDYELLIRVASKRERAQGLGHVKLQVAKTNSAQTLAVHISPTSLTLTSGGSQQRSVVGQRRRDFGNRALRRAHGNGEHKCNRDRYQRAGQFEISGGQSSDNSGSNHPSGGAHLEYDHVAERNRGSKLWRAIKCVGRRGPVRVACSGRESAAGNLAG